MTEFELAVMWVFVAAFAAMGGYFLTILYRMGRSDDPPVGMIRAGTVFIVAAVAIIVVAVAGKTAGAW